MKPKIKIENIDTLKNSFVVPDDYFNGLEDKINARKDEPLPRIKVEELVKMDESFMVPEGYFDELITKIDQRRNDKDDVVEFRSRRLRIWGWMVAAACISLVVLSVIKWGNNMENKFVETDTRLENISDAEIAGLLEERDDEFELTEEEIIEVISYTSIQDESTAIIDYLEEESDYTNDEDFLESI